MEKGADIDVVISGIMADFVGTKGKDGFDEVIQDFPNAEEVRILTYSRIGSYRFHSNLSHLKNLAPGTKLRIIVALPGIKNEKQKNGEYDYDRYTVASIKEELSKVKYQLDLDKYASEDFEMSVCLNNHAKLVGTENILYIGSANYSDFSQRNYEAGMLIRDKEVIRKIYHDYFDRIVAVRYYGDLDDEIRLNVLVMTNSLENALEDLKMNIELFAYFYDERRENMEKVKTIYLTLIEQAKELVGNLECYESNLVEKSIDDANGMLWDLEAIKNYIFNGFDSSYEKNTEFFADYYEEQHMKRKGVTTSDAWISEEMPYIKLCDEEEQDYFISQYWTENLLGKPEVVETMKILDGIAEKIHNLILYLNKTSYEKFESELTAIGNDENALK